MYMSNMGFLQVIVTQTLWIKHLFGHYDHHEKDPQTTWETFHVSLPELVWVPISDTTHSKQALESAAK